MGGHMNIGSMTSGSYGSGSPYDLGQWKWNVASSGSSSVIPRRVIHFTPTSTGVYVKMPDARTVPLGGPIYYFKNHAPTTYEITIGLRSDSGTTLAVLKPGDASESKHVAVAFCIDNTTEDGAWHFGIPRASKWATSPTS